MGAWLFSYKNQVTRAQLQPICHLLFSRAPFTPHSISALHPQAGGSSLVLVWGWIRLSSELLLLGTAVLNTGTEITAVTRDSQERAGRDTAPSWSGLECSGVDRRAVTAQRDLHSDVTWRRKRRKRRKRALLGWQGEHRALEHFSPNEDGSAGIQHASDEVAW